MQPQEKCVSLETARKLKEAGWDQKINGDTLAYCQRCVDERPDDDDEYFDLMEDDYYCHSCMCTSCEPEEYIAAPDVSELLEALPLTTSLGKIINKKLDGIAFGVMYDDGGEKMDFDFIDDSPVEALAMLWLEIKSKTP